MKNKIIIVVLILVVGVGAFYAGASYGKSKNPLSKMDGKNFTRSMNQDGVGQVNRIKGAGQMGGATSGEIISRDDKSVTIKLRDGGSKIVFFSNSTEVMKMTTTTVSDLINGKTVMISGASNADGSVSAKTIQLRDGAMPNIPTGQRDNKVIPENK